MPFSIQTHFLSLRYFYTLLSALLQLHLCNSLRFSSFMLVHAWSLPLCCFSFLFRPSEKEWACRAQTLCSTSGEKTKMANSWELYRHPSALNCWNSTNIVFCRVLIAVRRLLCSSGFTEYVVDKMCKCQINVICFFFIKNPNCYSFYWYRL